MSLIKVGTYNVGGYYNGTANKSKGKWLVSEDMLSAHRKAIEKMDCDILCVQEDRAFVNRKTVDIYDRIYRDIYPYKTECADARDDMNMIYSKFPIQQQTRIKLKPRVRFTARYMQHITVLIDEKPLNIINTHLEWESIKVRREQMLQIMNEIEPLKTVLVVGDMNPHGQIAYKQGSRSLPQVIHEELDMWRENNFFPLNGGNRYFKAMSTVVGKQKECAAFPCDNIIMKMGGDIFCTGNTQTLRELYMKDHLPFTAELSYGN